MRGVTLAEPGRTFASRVVGREPRALLSAFWLCVSVITLWFLTRIEPDSLGSFFAACMVGLTALLPSYLWCSGRAPGVPIFPLFALTHLWTYSLPLISGHPAVAGYPEPAQMFAGLTVAGYLGLATFVWYRTVNVAPRPPRSLRALEGGRADTFFLLALGSNVLFTMALSAGLLGPVTGALSLARGVILGLSAVATFSLSFRLGRRELSQTYAWAFLLLLVTYAFASVVSLMLVGALTASALAIIGFTLGSRRVPWVPIAFALLCLVPLHYGKASMRAKYWGSDWGGGQFAVRPWEYPAFLVEWVGEATDNILAADSGEGDVQPFLERASLVHLLLKAQDMTPKDVPYLAGATYVIIPELLLPRIIHPNKPASLEGVYLLNIHYGIQTREATATTAIGWGLLNESYANFGLIGCAGLALILGYGYGCVARWSLNTSILSARYLFSILLVSVALQTEFTASVYVTSLFQSTLSLAAVTFLFMKRYYLQLERLADDGRAVMSNARPDPAVRRG